MDFLLNCIEIVLDISGLLFSFEIDKCSFVQAIKLCINSLFKNPVLFDELKVVFILNSSEVVYRTSVTRLQPGENLITVYNDVCFKISDADLFVESN